MLNESDDLIIVNDGSIDSSREIIENFIKFDSRVKLINTPGLGLVKALNLGVESSENGWIARFDVDDNYPEFRLDLQRNLISEDIALIFADYEFVSEKGRPLGRVYSAVFPSQSALALVSGQRSAHPVALLNRQAIINCGGYDESKFPVEDLALWLKISNLGKIVSVPTVLLRYRLSVKSVSAQNRKIQNVNKSVLVKNFESWADLQLECQKNFKNTIALYETTSGSAQRIFLHMRDIFIVRKFTGIPVPIIWILRELGVLTTFKLAFVGVRVVTEAVTRRLYRFIGKYVEIFRVPW
jgi:glycosyltransferase involved in cell wall biosynthesis